MSPNLRMMRTRLWMNVFPCPPLNVTDSLSFMKLHVTSPFPFPPPPPPNQEVSRQGLSIAYALPARSGIEASNPVTATIQRRSVGRTYAVKREITSLTVVVLNHCGCAFDSLKLHSLGKEIEVIGISTNYAGFWRIRPVRRQPPHPELAICICEMKMGVSLTRRMYRVRRRKVGGKKSDHECTLYNT